MAKALCSRTSRSIAPPLVAGSAAILLYAFWSNQEPKSPMYVRGSISALGGAVAGLGLTALAVSRCD